MNKEEKEECIDIIEEILQWAAENGYDEISQYTNQLVELQQFLNGDR